VRFVKDYAAACPGAPGAVRTFKKGEVCTLWQIAGRRGQLLNRKSDPYWSEFDIDYAYIAPAACVRVLAVIEERSDLG
jgi:hypothetical protein